MTEDAPEPTKLCGNKDCARKRGPQPLSAFNRTKRTKSGRQSYCKLCTEAINKARVRSPRTMEMKIAESRGRAAALTIVSEPGGLEDQADLLAKATRLSLQTLIEVMEMKIAPEDPHYARLIAAKVAAARAAVGTQVRVDDQRLRRRTGDGLAKLLARIQAYGKPPIDAQPI